MRAVIGIYLSVLCDVINTSPVAQTYATETVRTTDFRVTGLDWFPSTN